MSYRKAYESVVDFVGKIDEYTTASGLRRNAGPGVEGRSGRCRGSGIAGEPAWPQEGRRADERTTRCRRRRPPPTGARAASGGQASRAAENTAQRRAVSAGSDCRGCRDFTNRRVWGVGFPRRE